MAKNIVKVAVTGAAGNIGYALLFRIASGEMFGKDTEIQLNLLELEPALPALKGIVMELEDCAFPLLKSIVSTSDLKEAFDDVDWALLVGSVPRKAGMERADLLKINGKIFIEQGKALEAVAKSSCRVIVVGNPCNTNAYIAKSVAKKIPKRNFFAMTMLDQSRAVSQIAQKAGVSSKSVENMAIWGNHSATQFPDVSHATIQGKPVPEVILDGEWLNNDFLETVQKRGAAIIKAKGSSSAASAANAILETVRRLNIPTQEGSFFSVAVCSDGSYGVPEGIMYSFPVRSNGIEWEIVQGIVHEEFAQQKLKATLEELLSEKKAIEEIL